MAQTEIDPACVAPPAGKKRVRIDWRRGAALLVAGEAPDAVAAALGITQDRLWLHLRRSARFQFLLRQARDAQWLLGRLKLEAAANAAAIRCAVKAEKPPAGLFEQFRNTSSPAWAEPSSIDGRDMVDRLADSLRRAPKRRPRPATTPAKAPDKAAISENRAQTSENKSQISGNKTQISPDKTQISADKAAISPHKAIADGEDVADKILKDQPAVRPQPPNTARVPPYGRVLGPPGARVDVFGRPLPEPDPLTEGRDRG